MSSTAKGVNERRIYQAANLTILCAGLVCLTALRLAEVDSVRESMSFLGHRLPSVCMYRNLTGRPCPGCGLTRSMALYLHGHPQAAHAVHPSGAWTLVWAGIQIALRFGLVCLRPRPGKVLITADVGLSCLSLLAASYLPRMLI